MDLPMLKRATVCAQDGRKNRRRSGSLRALLDLTTVERKRPLRFSVRESGRPFPVERCHPELVVHARLQSVVVCTLADPGRDRIDQALGQGWIALWHLAPRTELSSGELSDDDYCLPDRLERRRDRSCSMR